MTIELIIAMVIKEGLNEVDLLIVTILKLILTVQLGHSF